MFVREQPSRGRRRIRFDNFVFPFQRPAYAVTRGRFVVNNQNCSHHVVVPSPSPSATGNISRKRVPFPLRTGLSQEIVPPISPTRRPTMESPKPVPVGLVVK